MLRDREDEEFEAKLMQRLRAEEDADDGAPVADDDADEMVALTEALRSYRTETLHWAEQRSAAMPSPLPPGARAHRAAWLQAPQWALGTVALCTCVVGGAMYTRHQATLAENASVSLPNAPTQQALAADNQLLFLVDTAVRNPVEPSEQELGLTDSAMGERVQTHRHAQQRDN